MIIHIDGVPGSGKSYICTKVKIKCIDIDNLTEECIKYINHHKMNQDVSTLKRIMVIFRDKLIKHNKDIVFVGYSSLDMSMATHKYFIKIDDFNTTFRRLVHRELKKIIDNNALISKIISSEAHPSEINDSIIHRANINGGFPPDYDEWTKEYNDRVHKRVNEGYVLMTQNDIINALNSLLNV